MTQTTETAGLEPVGGPDLSRARWLAPAVIVDLVVVGGLAVAALVGWVAGSTRLVTPIEGTSPTQPLTAIAIAVLAFAVGLQAGRPGRIRRVLGAGAGAVVFVAASWSIIGYVLARRVPLDDLLFEDRLDAALHYPGRPSAQTLAVLLGLAVALIGLSGTDPRWSRSVALIGEAFSLAILTIVLVSFISGTGEIAVFDGALAMSWPTAAVALLLLLGMLAAKPERPPLVWLADGTIDGFTVSRVLPVIVLVPFIVRVVQALGEYAGLSASFAMLAAELVALGVIGVALIGTSLAKQRAEDELAQRQAIYRTAIDALNEGLTIRSADGETAVTNPAAQDIASGVYREDSGADPVAIGLTWYDEQGAPIPVADMPTNVTMRTGMPVRARMVRIGHDDDARWILVNAVPLDDEGGVVTTMSDVTDRTWAERRLRDAEELFRTAFEHAPIGMAMVAPNGAFRQVNPAFCALLGMDRAEIEAETSERLTHPDDVAENVRLSKQLLGGEIAAYSLDKRYRHADGSWVWTTMSVSLVRRSDGSPEHFVAQIVDLRERKRLEFELSHLAMHDALTELPNRRLVLDRLGHAIQRSARREERVGVIYIDLDGFKDINDSFGHEVGDGVLVEVSRRLRASLRQSDTAGRLGGDEFIVISEDLAGAAALDELVARVEADLHDDVRIGDRTVPLRASVGACLATPGDDAATLLRIADGAMYAVKRRRRSEMKTRLHIVPEPEDGTLDGA